MQPAEGLKLNKNELSFELGPIRPPSEARSLLLRVTRNCPWNQCLFCRTYKKRKFSLRSVDEIKQDIQTARDIADEILAISLKAGSGGRVDDRVISHIFGESGYSENFRSIAMWMYYGTGACFLQDADNLVMKSDYLVDVLKFLRERFPQITRVTTYSRSRTIVRKKVESLTEIRKSGLNRVHIGLETGYDPLLKYMKKGVTAAQHIEAGQKVKMAGMEVSEYVMPGLGGQEMWAEHAVETAKVLNQINPDFIRLRSLRVLPIVALYEKMAEGSFTRQSDDMVVEEIKLFINTLDGISSIITSDHISNLLEEITGRLPDDKGKMLNVISKYQALPEQERIIYRVGRRGGAYRSTDDLTFDPSTYGKIRNLIKDISLKQGPDGVERFITEMGDSYI
ncbi:Radical SAM domain protein [uncultured Desulfobacterium sp.]|uniref:Radical SAM domain protein n=1 Tax=uncultured Desulfobacterium sp. TaxID=201089 RepID=A0A445N302_9BACT|nr:Radical SAM domain protein [uncultured Desulfobacterium sp.]